MPFNALTHKWLFRMTQGRHRKIQTHRKGSTGSCFRRHICVSASPLILILRRASVSWLPSPFPKLAKGRQISGLLCIGERRPDWAGIRWLKAVPSSCPMSLLPSVHLLHLYLFFLKSQSEDNSFFSNAKRIIQTHSLGD